MNVAGVQTCALPISAGGLKFRQRSIQSLIGSDSIFGLREQSLDDFLEGVLLHQSVGGSETLPKAQLPPARNYFLLVCFFAGFIGGLAALPVFLAAVFFLGLGIIGSVSFQCLMEGVIAHRRLYHNLAKWLVTWRPPSFD